MLNKKVNIENSMIIYLLSFPLSTLSKYKELYTVVIKIIVPFIYVKCITTIVQKGGRWNRIKQE